MFDSLKKKVFDVDTKQPNKIAGEIKRLQEERAERKRLHDE